MTILESTLETLGISHKDIAMSKVGFRVAEGGRFASILFPNETEGCPCASSYPKHTNCMLFGVNDKEEDASVAPEVFEDAVVFAVYVAICYPYWLHVAV